jgi:hypothetical protein
MKRLNQTKKYEKQDQQGKAAFNERKPATFSVLLFCCVFCINH